MKSLAHHSQEKDGRQRAVRFYFDTTSSQGGFHRVLLHAVCQFHGFHAVSNTTRVGGKSARVLTVTGILSSQHRLVPLLQPKPST
mmetsp:Transcript_6190/g.13943  ORF Transcript_6190/g.13943 Transcript_6190/m.13943 type:complete len:85 (+) Transcript_6190:52-306(+)